MTSAWTVTHGAAAIGGGDLSFRVAPTGSAECVLALSFNQMAADLEKLSTRLRRNLFADVCHELAIPLTVIQGNLRVRCWTMCIRWTRPRWPGSTSRRAT